MRLEHVPTQWQVSFLASVHTFRLAHAKLGFCTGGKLVIDMNDSPLFEAWQAVRLLENAAVTAFHDAMKNGNRDMPPLEAVTTLSAPIIPPHGHVGYR